MRGPSPPPPTRAGGGGSRSGEDLEQPGSALAAADAHRHDAPLRAAPLALLEDVARTARPGHPERVPDGDRAAVDVVLLRVDPQPVTRVQALAGERLVQLPQVDVV